MSSDVRPSLLFLTTPPRLVPCLRASKRLYGVFILFGILTCGITCCLFICVYRRHSQPKRPLRDRKKKETQLFAEINPYWEQRGLRWEFRYRVVRSEEEEENFKDRRIFVCFLVVCLYSYPMLFLFLEAKCRLCPVVFFTRFVCCFLPYGAPSGWRLCPSSDRQHPARRTYALRTVHEARWPHSCEM